MSVKCKNCINLDEEWCGVKRDFPDEEMERECIYFKAKTNADRIRAMTDEELADWFSAIAEDAVLNGGKIKSAVWLSWLKSPVEEADNGT